MIGVPSPSAEADIVGITWAHVTAVGNPDPAFPENPKIPMCRYGQVTFTTADVAVRVILSRVDVAKKCVVDVVDALKAIRSFRP